MCLSSRTCKTNTDLNSLRSSTVTPTSNGSPRELPRQPCRQMYPPAMFPTVGSMSISESSLSAQLSGWPSAFKKVASSRAPLTHLSHASSVDHTRVLDKAVQHISREPQCLVHLHQMVPVASCAVAWTGDVHADPKSKPCVPNLKEKRHLQDLGVQHPSHGTVEDVSHGGFSNVVAVEEESLEYPWLMGVQNEDISFPPRTSQVQGF